MLSSTSTFGEAVLEPGAACPLWAALCVALDMSSGLVKSTTVFHSAELSHSLKTSDRRRKHAGIGPESFGILVCRSVGSAPGIFGLVLSGVGADLGPNSTIFRVGV